MSLRLVVLGTIAVAMAAPRCSSAARLAAIARRAQRHDPELALRQAPGSLTGNPDEGSWGVDLGWTLDVSGSWRPRGGSAQQDVERARRQIDDALRDLDERVATGVAELAGAQRAVAREARLADLAKELAGAERQRLDAGTGTQLDLDAPTRAQSLRRLEEHGRRFDEAVHEVRLARARWQRLSTNNPDEASQ